MIQVKEVAIIGPASFRSRLASDVDECRTTCMKDTQQCINSQGSYNCKCKAGYEKKNGAADDECTKGKSLSFVGLLIKHHP